MSILSGQGHSLGRAALGRYKNALVDPGQDAVDPAGMTPGLDVYCGYQAGAPGYQSGSFSNMPEIEARFPGKLYVCVGTDVIDIEPGLSPPSAAPGFVRNWTPGPGTHLDKPMIYADLSVMIQVVQVLQAAGISRDQYYLWLAEWDGNPAIGSQYDAKQYRNTQGYDDDSFEAYIFTSATVQPPPPAPAMSRSLTIHNRVGNLTYGPLPAGCDHVVIQYDDGTMVTEITRTTGTRIEGLIIPGGDAGKIIINPIVHGRVTDQVSIQLP